MDVSDLRDFSLFDGLSDAQLGELVSRGEQVVIEPGRELFHEGDHADWWWVLVDGSVELLRHVGREDVVVGRLDVPGRWAGGFRAWDEQGVYLATARGVTPGRLLRVSAEALAQLSREWFPFAGHLIEGLYRTARSIESTARQREALVSLGTLAAGLAHEINNPAAASTRAVAGLEVAWSMLLGSLGRLAEGQITARQFSELDRLRLGLSGLAPGTDALDRADLEDEVAIWLEAHGVPEAWSLAPTLVGGGASVEWCNEAEAVLGAEALGPGLVWVASTLSASALLSEIGESTRRITELVAAVRSYSQMDRASRQQTDVTEGLESTLVMLGHKLRDGVTVIREYGPDVPALQAYPGELNQVWTNLMDNAVDAMDGRGTLRLTTRADGGHVVVEIADTGPGMSADVAARAFEAFYTTKDVGKGTGLGLDIARRIVVERHGGAIQLDPGPDGTTVLVRLPIR